tara:strand:- start:2624 stop:3079 length:456 start_codon:yes stop_codon:yes gene_type:complete
MGSEKVPWSGCCLAIGTGAPIDHLRLIDLKSGVIRSGQAGPYPNRAINVGRLSATPADHVVMVVANSIFEERRRACRLDATNQSLFGQHSKGIVDPLSRDGADIGSDQFGNGFRRAVRLTGNRPEDGDPLGRDGNSVLSKKFDWIRHSPKE